jgi:hypothetical protein
LSLLATCTDTVASEHGWPCTKKYSVYKEMITCAYCD